MGRKIAVFGCGYWGQNLVRNYYQMGRLGLVCDLAEKGRNRAAEIAPGTPLLDSFDEALDREDVQGVVLATPAETHCSLCIKALQAGKDVFVEKPFALRCEDAEAMHAESLKRRRILMVGHLLEYHPAVLQLREMVNQGILGQINYIYSNRLNFGKIRVEENALWSFAPHDIAIILRLAGTPPVEVTCVGGSYITPNLADVTVSTLLFKDGMRAHIFVSWLNPFKEQKLVVVGERNMMVFNDTVKDEKLLLYEQCVELRDRQPILQKGVCRNIPVRPDEPLKLECEHFLHCMETREAPLTDGISGINVTKVLQACQTSLQSNGRPTSLDKRLL